MVHPICLLVHLTKSERSTVKTSSFFNKRVIKHTIFLQFSLKDCIFNIPISETAICHTQTENVRWIAQYTCGLGERKLWQFYISIIMSYSFKFAHMYCEEINQQCFHHLLPRDWLHIIKMRNYTSNLHHLSSIFIINIREANCFNSKK